MKTIFYFFQESVKKIQMSEIWSKVLHNRATGQVILIEKSAVTSVWRSCWYTKLVNQNSGQERHILRIMLDLLSKFI